MKIDAADLTSAIPEIMTLLDEEVLNVTTKVTLDVDADLILATAVDTGEARQGWQAITPSKPYDLGIVENNVEHIVYLNDGHSKQSPAGFVESIVEKHKHGG